MQKLKILWPILVLANYQTALRRLFSRILQWREVIRLYKKLVAERGEEFRSSELYLWEKTVCHVLGKWHLTFERMNE